MFSCNSIKKGLFWLVTGKEDWITEQTEQCAWRTAAHSWQEMHTATHSAIASLAALTGETAPLERSHSVDVMLLRIAPIHSLMESVIRWAFKKTHRVRIRINSGHFIPRKTKDKLTNCFTTFTESDSSSLKVIHKLFLIAFILVHIDWYLIFFSDW